MILKYKNCLYNEINLKIILSIYITMKFTYYKIKKKYIKRYIH